MKCFFATLVEIVIVKQPFVAVKWMFYRLQAVKQPFYSNKRLFYKYDFYQAIELGDAGKQFLIWHCCQKLYLKARISGIRINEVNKEKNYTHPLSFSRCSNSIILKLNAYHISCSHLIGTLTFQTLMLGIKIIKVSKSRA